MATVTVLELAVFRGAKSEDDSMSGSEIERVGLPFMGGCGACGATIACYNASPSKNGYLMCSEGCIGDSGYDTVEEADAALFPKEKPLMRAIEEHANFANGPEPETIRVEGVEYRAGGRKTPILLSFSKNDEKNPLLISLETLREIVKWAEDDSY
jgi:predicted  nucleic acid-binding Zn-ribbon protein